MNIDQDPIYTTKFKKFIRFMGEKFTPFILNIASFFLLLFIFGRILASYGIERLFVLFMVIFVMSLKLGDKKE
jgi:hypothetical protein